MSVYCQCSLRVSRGWSGYETAGVTWGFPGDSPPEQARPSIMLQIRGSLGSFGQCLLASVV